MTEHDQDPMKKLLQQALPPVKADAEPSRDLWPAMLRRLDEDSATQRAPAQTGFNWAWFDGALAAGLALLIASFPASIPLLLYYL
jgi:hypothetical protein